MIKLTLFNLALRRREFVAGGPGFATFFSTPSAMILDDTDDDERKCSAIRGCGGHARNVTTKYRLAMVDRWRCKLYSFKMVGIWKTRYDGTCLSFKSWFLCTGSQFTDGVYPEMVRIQKTLGTIAMVIVFKSQFLIDGDVNCIPSRWCRRFDGTCLSPQFLTDGDVNCISSRWCGFRRLGSMVLVFQNHNSWLMEM